MAFNFNWTPLVASTSSPEFYIHAKELLAKALNKTAKPSVIVDSNITVEGLNLGTQAPELEVLEIGDLAEDRFRGVFRMTYDGGAFLTLRARVQVNPLCTYINTSPRFTSPHPLSVASTPLTIPVKLTLSEFKLSGFVILVFSKEKGITLVFRNDPLESMRVQSSFDSIPFIKNYLQKEIERQVRGLFQEELPLAVYKLSLRLLDPDNGDGGSTTGQSQDKLSTESLLSPTEEQEHEEDDIATEETEAFSERNMLRLRALMNSQKTLSLFTPILDGAIFRATPPSSIWDYLRTIPTDAASTSASAPGLRPGLHSRSSSMSVSSSHVRRKRKHRVVNLRKGKESTASAPSSEVFLSEYADTETVASAPEILGNTTGGTELLVPPERLRKLSLVDESSLRYSDCQQPPPPSTPVRSRRSYLESSFMETLPRSPERRPQLSRGARNPSGIVEKAFVMQFMAEMRRQVEERQEEESWRS